MLRRCAGGALAALALTVLAPMAVASAEETKPLYFGAGKGTFAGPVYLQSSAPCPASTTYINTSMYGKGLPSDGAVVQGTSTVDFKINQTFPFRFDDSMAGIAATNQVVLDGKYKVVATCWDSDLSKPLLRFVGVMNFPGKQTWTASPVWQGNPADAPSTPGPLGPGGVIKGGEAPVVPATPAPVPGASTTPGSPGAGPSAAPSAGGDASAPTDPAAVPAASGARDTTTSGDWTRWGLVIAALALLGLAAYWSVSSRQRDDIDPQDADTVDDELTSSGRT